MKIYRILLLVILVIFLFSACDAKSTTEVFKNYEKLDINNRDSNVYLTNDSFNQIESNISSGLKIKPKKIEDNFYIIYELSDGRILNVLPNDFNNKYKWAIVIHKK